MKVITKIIDFVFYKLKEPIKKYLLDLEIGVVLYYLPFMNNWFLKNALKVILKKMNDGTINPLMHELHYFSSVEQGKIIVRRIENAQTISDWNDAINAGMQSTNNKNAN